MQSQQTNYGRVDFAVIPVFSNWHVRIKVSESKGKSLGAAKWNREAQWRLRKESESPAGNGSRVYARGARYRSDSRRGFLYRTVLIRNYTAPVARISRHLRSPAAPELAGRFSRSPRSSDLSRLVRADWAIVNPNFRRKLSEQHFRAGHS